jgi:hypothetical protein
LTAEEAARRAAASGGLPGLAIDFAGESAELAELCARLVAGRAAPEEVAKRLGDLAQERDERSAFERRRRAGLALCGVLASELRKQLMVESDNRRLQDLLLDVATASRNLLAPATPELVVDALLERFRNETLDRPR